MNAYDAEYFQWLCGLIAATNRLHYGKLLEDLFLDDFLPKLYMDENRFADGMALRDEWLSATGASPVCQNYIYKVMNNEKCCSILEMMIALAIRAERNIMQDDDFGNRAPTWFWGMVDNLGLMEMTDDRYDPEFVEEVLDNLNNRNYAPNGEGGLFTVNSRTEDMRNVDIWYQMLWYLAEQF